MTSSTMPPPPPPPASSPPPGTPPGGGMPKWLVFLLVAILVVVLGCCGFWRACTWMCSKGVQTAGKAAGDFVKDQQKKAGVEVDNAGVSLPANFPDVPVYSGFKAISKVAPPGEQAGQVTFQGKGTAAQLGRYYEGEMAKRGWKQAAASADADSVVQSYTKDNQEVGIIVGGSGDSCNLIISYSKH